MEKLTFNNKNKPKRFFREHKIEIMLSSIFVLIIIIFFLPLRNPSPHPTLTTAQIKEMKLKDSIDERQRFIQNRIYDSTAVFNQKKQAIEDSITKDKEEKRIAKLPYLEREKIRRDKEKEKRDKYLLSTYGDEDGQLMIERKVKIGWNEDKCTASWGKPYDINTTTTAVMIHEQWVYRHNRYLYFENGILTTIQN